MAGTLEKVISQEEALSFLLPQVNQVGVCSYRGRWSIYAVEASSCGAQLLAKKTRGPTPGLSVKNILI